MSLLFLEKAITPPSLDGFSDGSILDNIGKFLDFIFTPYFGPYKG